MATRPWPLASAVKALPMVAPRPRSTSTAFIAWAGLSEGGAGPLTDRRPATRHARGKWPRLAALASSPHAHAPALRRAFHANAVAGVAAYAELADAVDAGSAVAPAKAVNALLGALAVG